MSSHGPTPSPTDGTTHPAGSIRPEVSRARDGDAAALGWLYDTFAPRLLRRLRARFGAVPGLDGEDLLQDTFVYVLSDGGRVLDRFLAAPDPDEEAFARFLWSAACGIASNRRRSLVRHPSAPLPESRETTPQPGSEGRTLARDALVRLGRCLFRSGERIHLYFQMRYRDGLQPGEIAEVTGWSRKATYKLKQALDHALDKCVDDLGLTS